MLAKTVARPPLKTHKWSHLPGQAAPGDVEGPVFVLPVVRLKLIDLFVRPELCCVDAVLRQHMAHPHAMTRLDQLGGKHRRRVATQRLVGVITLELDTY
uniref:Uncharacterized protein n=1 Tax=Hyaloperonospora arabidopsidis (strain Emoy2) TaxID=559515 RepID=M4BYX1_HYAAE